MLKLWQHLASPGHNEFSNGGESFAITNFASGNGSSLILCQAIARTIEASGTSFNKIQSKFHHFHFRKCMLSAKWLPFCQFAYWILAVEQPFCQVDNLHGHLEEKPWLLDCVAPNTIYTGRDYWNSRYFARSCCKYDFNVSHNSNSQSLDPVTHTYGPGKWGMTPWWPSLILLSWRPLCHCKSFENQDGRWNLQVLEWLDFKVVIVDFFTQRHCLQNNGSLLLIL